MNALLKSQSKRLKLVMLWSFIFLFVGILVLFINPSALKDMGVYLGLTSIPLIGYIIGETIRPSKTNI